eukprot:GHVU01008290.1.p3 GENE.GHVU01008290.1~~GHVU01008290.1.p3  ORF type:complete len:102 (+),score=2.23 GHVU01008290.1:3733-4038(+)
MMVMSITGGKERVTELLPLLLEDPAERVGVLLKPMHEIDEHFYALPLDNATSKSIINCSFISKCHVPGNLRAGFIRISGQPTLRAREMSRATDSEYKTVCL